MNKKRGAVDSVIISASEKTRGRHTLSKIISSYNTFK
jgi:hypothetical protein